MDTKSKVLRFTIIGITALSLTSGIILGCTEKEEKPQVEEKSQVEEKLPEYESAVLPEDSEASRMIDFEELIDNYIGIDKIVQFVDENISKVSKEKASYIIIELEEAQKRYLPKLDERFYSEGVQNKLQKIHPINLSYSDIENIQSNEIKELLLETINNGYKVETAEGMYFPIISYEHYRKYRDYVEEDIRAYIEIMAVESNGSPAQDGALVIGGWDEVVNRALGQELLFIAEHKSSPKMENVQELHKKYKNFILYGLSNTPLFDYETKTMVPEAKEAYLELIESNKESRIKEMVKSYMEVISKNNYKLTDEVERFRKLYLEGIK